MPESTICVLWGSGAQGQKKTQAKQWIEYDSNVAEVDGSIHVFSDAAMSDEEEDAGPERMREKHVLLHHVPQVTFTLVLDGRFAWTTHVTCAVMVSVMLLISLQSIGLEVCLSVTLMSDDSVSLWLLVVISFLFYLVL